MKLTCSSFGDPERGGRLETYGLFMEKLPIPSPTDSERATLATLARRAHRVHLHRRKTVERMLKACGVDPASSTSRNSLEQPWKLTQGEFSRRVRDGDRSIFDKAHNETVALTEEIEKVEHEIDQRVQALYGF